MIKVLFICHGNICRSPMAEFVLKDIVEKRGLTSNFEIASAATSNEEIWSGTGNPVYPPAQAELRKHGIGKTVYTNFSEKRARQVTKEDYRYYDYLLCADANNIKNTIRITGPDVDGKIKLLLDRHPAHPYGFPHHFLEFHRCTLQSLTAHPPVLRSCPITTAR